MKAEMWNRKYWIDSNKLSIIDYKKLLAKSGFSIFSHMDHKFTPLGYTSIYLLGESHLAIHEFPEAGQDYIELTSCNEKMLLNFHEMLLVLANKKNAKIRTPNLLSLASGEFIDKESHFVYESLRRGSLYWVCKFDKILIHKKTKFQEFAILEKDKIKSLWIDGCFQSKEDTEYVYHEMLVHPAMMGKKIVSSVLVLGGGEGSVLRELLRYPEVKRITMIDIDGELINACKKYLSSWHRGSFNNPKVKLKIGDAFEYIKKCKQKFDLIILDLPAVASDVSDNLNIITKKYISTVFYKGLQHILTDKGLIVSYFGDNYDSENFRISVRNVAKKIFSNFWIFRINAHLLKMFIISKNDIEIYNINREHANLTNIVEQINASIDERLTGNLKYYNGIEHIASFALSNNMKAWK